MCLDTITEKNPKRKWGVAYKVVNEDFTSIYEGWYVYIPGTTLVDKKNWNIHTANDSYTTGFHCFLHLKSAMEDLRSRQVTSSSVPPHKIIKLHWFEPTAFGCSIRLLSKRRSKQVVARRIKILKVINPASVKI